MKNCTNLVQKYRVHFTVIARDNIEYIYKR